MLESGHADITVVDERDGRESCREGAFPGVGGGRFFGYGETDTENMLIRGDDLDAFKVLLPVVRS